MKRIGKFKLTKKLIAELWDDLDRTMSIESLEHYALLKYLDIYRTDTGNKKDAIDFTYDGIEDESDLYINIGENEEVSFRKGRLIWNR